MQNTALTLTLIATAVILACFLWVLGRTRAAVPIEKIAPKAYRLRAILFWGLLMAGLVLTVMTLSPWPHNTEIDRVSRHIDVKARQWSWELSDAQVKVGEVIEFRVTAEDVSHGFGLYDGNKKLVAQIQAMPGFVNKVRYHFDRPGQYEILCLEYCGVAHHGMTAVLHVTHADTARN